MRDLIQHPLWQAKDLGAPIPDSPHAVSVCLPTWQDNVGYEEQDPRVHERLSTGYPRFVYNRFCRDLFEDCEVQFAHPGEACQVYPSRPAAERCAAFLRARSEGPVHTEALGRHGTLTVCFSQRDAGLARDYWQHTGEGISSRQAEVCLVGGPTVDGTEAKTLLSERIAACAGVGAQDILLFPCGMTALFTLHRVLRDLFPGRKSVQFGFPYVDTLKVQEKFGAGVHFWPRGDSAELQQLRRVLEQEPVSGLYTEFPTNPLLVSPDIECLADLARRYECPLIVDDTVAGFVNADLLPAADVICSSLTKTFSGIGNVTGGSLVLNPSGPFYEELSLRLRQAAVGNDVIWGADAVVLEQNSRDFQRRVRCMNENAEALADFLDRQPNVAEVFYPKYQTAEMYRAFRRAKGGYGCLMSISFVDAARSAPRFFDALRVNKGPNLGTNYTLACPYTILAHYRELDFAESCGVSRFLVRVSVGLEDSDDLIERFHEALAAIQA